MTKAIRLISPWKKLTLGAVLCGLFATVAPAAIQLTVTATFHEDCATINYADGDDIVFSVVLTEDATSASYDPGENLYIWTYASNGVTAMSGDTLTGTLDGSLADTMVMAGSNMLFIMFPYDEGETDLGISINGTADHLTGAYLAFNMVDDVFTVDSESTPSLTDFLKPALGTYATGPVSSDAGVSLMTLDAMNQMDITSVTISEINVPEPSTYTLMGGVAVLAVSLVIRCVRRRR